MIPRTRVESHLEFEPKERRCTAPLRPESLSAPALFLRFSDHILLIVLYMVRFKKPQCLAERPVTRCDVCVSTVVPIHSAPRHV